MIKISIIVPVYNGIKHLRPCLESLLNQDLPLNEYEIICVNDGSTDESLDLLKEFQTKSSNILVYNKENGGLGSALNLGIKKANGNYIWLVNQDDVVRYNCLGMITSFLERNAIDLFVFKYTDVSEKWVMDNNFNDNLRDIWIENHLTKRNFDFVEPFVKIVKREVVLNNNLFFNESLFWMEDTYWTFILFKYIPNAVFTDVSFYYYRYVASSISSVKNVNNILKRNQSSLIFYNILKEEQKNNNLLKNDTLLNQFVSDYLDFGIVQSILVGILLLPSFKMKVQELNKLKANKMYPFKNSIKILKKTDNIKSNLINYVMFFSSNELYFYFLCVVSNLYLKIKRLVKN